MSAKEGLATMTLRELKAAEIQWTTEVSKLERAIKNGVALGGHNKQESLDWAKKRLKAIKAEIKSRKRSKGGKSK